MRNDSILGRRVWWVVSLLALLGAAGARGEYFDVSVMPREGEKFKAADYRLWLPDGAGRLRGIVIRQHGCGNPAVSTGLSNANDVQWQALAGKHGCALLATRLTTMKACQDWADPANGTAEALLQALHALAVATGRAEVETVPWVLSGHSGGAFWTASMVFKFPRRIAVAVPMRGTLPAVDNDAMNTLFMHSFPASPSPEVAAVPVLWASGAKDTLINKKTDPKQVFSRPPEALWTLAVDPKAGHELGNLRLLELPYLDAVMARRLPESGDVLRPMTMAGAWLGDIMTGQIMPAEKFTGDRRKAAWLPDESLARRWRQHVQDGAIPPAAAPIAPTQVKAVRSGGAVVVSWQWPPPLDGPMASFRIYRNGQPIGTLPPQRHGYSDEPTPVRWARMFKDAQPVAGAEASYEVTALYEPPEAVGGGLESSRSAAVGVSEIAPAVASLPDLVVADVTMTPENPADGQLVTVTAKIENRGDAAVPAGVWISAMIRLGRGEVTWGHVVGPLEPGKAVVLSAVHPVAFKADTPDGNVAIVVEADELGRVGEKDDANNVLVRMVKRTPAAGKLDTFNYAIGTQTFDPVYQFTKDTRLVETAQAILDMGSNTIKFHLSRQYHGDRRNVPQASPAVHTLRDLVREEPSHRKVLDMPFAYYVMWAYPMNSGGWNRGFSPASQEKEYQEMYELACHLLETYSGSGKTFLLGHWEGDWSLRGTGNMTDEEKVKPEAIQGMIDWLNARQRAIDDAKRNTRHQNVQVFNYTEVNLAKLAMQGRKTVANDVLPKTNIDYVSYSSYDTQTDAQQLTASLNYIQSKLPDKEGIVGKRVFIGEYGFGNISPEKQDAQSRLVMRTGLEWGCPFILYWEMYNNEIDKDGRNRFFWMIDEKGVKQPIYYTHQRFYQWARGHVADFARTAHRQPSFDEFRKAAVEYLDRPLLP